MYTPRLLLHFCIFNGVISCLNASTEKEVDYLLDSLTESRWLSSTMNSNLEKVVPKKNDDLYKAIRKKMIQTLQGKKIHTVVYVNYPDELGIATIEDRDAASVQIRLVNNEVGKSDDKLKPARHWTHHDIVSEWNAGKTPSEASLEQRRVGAFYEGMLQLRVKGLLLACFAYENQLDSAGIISLKRQNLITSNQAIMAGLCQDYHVAQSMCLFFIDHVADWNEENSVSFKTWEFQYNTFEEYYQSELGIQSKIRWATLIEGSSGR